MRAERGARRKERRGPEVSRGEARWRAVKCRPPRREETRNSRMTDDAMRYCMPREHDARRGSEWRRGGIMLRRIRASRRPIHIHRPVLAWARGNSTIVDGSFSPTSCARRREWYLPRIAAGGLGDMPLPRCGAQNVARLARSHSGNDRACTAEAQRSLLGIREIGLSDAQIPRRRKHR